MVEHDVGEREWASSLGTLISFLARLWLFRTRRVRGAKALWHIYHEAKLLEAWVEETKTVVEEAYEAYALRGELPLQGSGVSEVGAGQGGPREVDGFGDESPPTQKSSEIPV